MITIKIDNTTTSEINIKNRNKRVKVYMSDCSGRTKEIDWVFTKNQTGIDKVNKVIETFEKVKEMLKK